MKKNNDLELIFTVVLFVVILFVLTKRIEAPSSKIEEITVQSLTPTKKIKNIKSVKVSRCQNLEYMMDENIQLSQLINHLKSNYPRTVYLPSVKNIELRFSNEETRRMQLVYNVDQRNNIYRILKWYRLDSENLPYQVKSPINSYNPSDKVLSDILSRGKIDWVKEDGTIYIPEINSHLIVQVEDSNLVNLEWVQGDSLIFCNSRNGALKCRCS